MLFTKLSEVNKKFKYCSVEKVLVQSMFVNTDYWTTPVENNPIVGQRY
jgi:hypothetical protein